jgi:hypothetical protein
MLRDNKLRDQLHDMVATLPGMLHCVGSCMDAFPASAGIQSAACGLLAALAESQPAQAELPTSPWLTRLQRAMTLPSFRCSLDAQARVYAALAALSPISAARCVGFVPSIVAAVQLEHGPVHLAGYKFLSKQLRSAEVCAMIRDCEGGTEVLGIAVSCVVLSFFNVDL